MDLGAILDNSHMPGFEFARDDVKRLGLAAQNLAPGVTMFSGHDAGVSYRFFVEYVENVEISRKLKYYKPDPVEMIQWTIEKQNKPTEQVRFLPPELLQFDELTGECTGGKYAESYIRFKNGLSAPGFPLSNWSEIGRADLETLAHAGIFSIEQLAVQSDEKMRKFHDSIQEVFQKAVRWNAGKDKRVETEKIAQELLAVTQSNSKLEEQLRLQQEQIAKLMEEAPAAVVRKAGRPRKDENAD
jgi:hypothetical protein